jgi:hypothetical protein
MGCKRLFNARQTLHPPISSGEMQLFTWFDEAIPYQGGRSSAGMGVGEGRETKGAGFNPKTSYTTRTMQGTVELCPAGSIPPRDELQQVVSLFQRMRSAFLTNRM